MESSRNMRALPEDLIPEILLKLPVKSLLRFSLYRGSLQNLQIPLLSVHSYDSLSHISPDLQIPHDGNVSHIEICGPCNGLFCISVNRQDIILSNPFLREFRSLQCRTFQPDPLRWFDVGIGFEYDSSTEDYKIVRIVTERPLDTIYFAEVYEHSNHSWREINNHMFEEQNPLQLSSTTNWNETIHWVNCNKEILSFDIKTEVFRFLMLPSEPLNEGKKMHLTVLHEFLSVFAYTSSYDHQTEQYIDLWKMGDYGVEESWTKLLLLDLCLEFNVPFCCGKMKPSFSKDLSFRWTTILHQGNCSAIQLPP